MGYNNIMNYKKQIKDNYTLHLINTDRFKKVELSIRFTKSFDVQTAACLKLFSRLLKYNDLKGLTNEELFKKLEYLYGSKVNYNFLINSKNMIFEIRCDFLNNKYTSDNINKEIINLLKDIINKQIFNENTFNIEKESLIKSIENIKDDTSTYSTFKYDEIFFKGSIYEENIYKNINVFKNITLEDIVKTYKSLFNSFKIDVFVLGNINEEDLDIDYLFNNFKQGIDYSKDLYIKINPKKEEVKEKHYSADSNLYMGLIINNITKDEREYKLLVFNTILGCMNNSLLFMNVREDNSLCYFINSTINRFTDSITINSLINKDNYNKVVNIIKDTLNSMKDETVVKPLVETAIKTINISFNDYYDNARKQLEFYYLSEFTDMPSIETRKENINKVNVNDIVNIANKIDIRTIFLLEGDNK